MIDDIRKLEHGRVELTFVPCPHCQQKHKLIVRKDELYDWWGGMPAAKAFPNLLPAQVELFLTGIGGECWKEVFKDGE